MASDRPAFPAKHSLQTRAYGGGVRAFSKTPPSGFNRGANQSDGSPNFSISLNLEGGSPGLHLPRICTLKMVFLDIVSQPINALNCPFIRKEELRPLAQAPRLTPESVRLMARRSEIPLEQILLASTPISLNSCRLTCCEG